MFHNKDHVVLLKEVQIDIAKLEEAIRNISFTRHNLKHNCMEVKSDIQTTVTQQLEALRERELYLLQQVDLAQQTKEAVLQGQEDELHEALGGLNNVLKLDEAGGAAAAGEHIKVTLESLKNLTLHPKDTPNLAFKANVANLSNTISTFGSLDTRAMPLNSMFDEESASTSLPKAFEDYGDEDHHVLYKTVGGSQANSGGNKISVGIPRLSKKPEDWLFMPSDQLQSHTASFQDHTSPSTIPMFSPFLTTNVTGWIDKHDKMNHSMSSAASIHQWLCDIQGQGEEEETEADFEVLSPPPCNKESTQGSSIEVLSSEDAIFFTTTPISDGVSGLSETSEFSNILSYFNHVKAASNENWLREEITTCNESSAGYCNEVLHYFRNISNDTKDWLMEYTKKQPQQNQDTVSPCSSETPCKWTSSAVDIENLDKLVCVHDSVSRVFDELNPDLKGWLLKAKDEDLDMDETQGYEGTDVKNVCKANEPCQTFNECVSDENCCNRLANVSQNIKNQETSESNYFHTFDRFDAVKQQNASDWLLTEDQAMGDSKVCDDTLENQILFSPFANPCHINSWLLASQASCGNGNMSVTGLLKQSFDKESMPNLWLRPLEEVSSMDIQKLSLDWQSMFCHQTQGQDMQDNCLAYEKLSGLDREDLGMWLVSINKQVPGSARSDISFNTSYSIKEKYQGNSNLKSWLYEPENSTFSRTIESPEKKLGPSYSKAIELPECEDEPLNDTKSALTDALFSCFHKKSADNHTWLLQSGPLID